MCKNALLIKTTEQIAEYRYHHLTAHFITSNSFNDCIVSHLPPPLQAIQFYFRGIFDFIARSAINEIVESTQERIER